MEPDVVRSFDFATLTEDGSSTEVASRSRVGKYSIEQELGRGGFGCVYRACDTSTGQHVALKMFLPRHSWNKKSRDLFLREANIVRNLVHPNVVPVRDVGESEGIPYVVFE